MPPRKRAQPRPLPATPTVTVVSKPEHVEALRATWRGTAEQKAAQLWRFLRLYVFSFVGQVLAQVITTAIAGGVDVTNLDRKAIGALLIPAAELVWRQKHPALTAGAVDTAPGVTIVPSEVVPTDVPGGTGGPGDITTPPDGGAAILALIGIVMAIIGGVFLLVGLAHHLLDTFGLIVLLIGLALLYFDRNGRNVL